MTLVFFLNFFAALILAQAAEAWIKIRFPDSIPGKVLSTIS